MTTMNAQLADLETRTTTMREDLTTQKAKLAALGDQRDEAYAVIARTEDDNEVTVKARLLLESYSELEQRVLRDKVEGLVTAGLQTIFGSGYFFAVEVKTLRGQAAMEFTVRKDGVISDPMDSHGGGLVNIVSMVLRLVIVALTPGLGRTVVLDEPFAHLSQGYIEGVSKFIRGIVDSTGIQLIIVSHEAEIAEVADQAYRLFERDGVTMVERMDD